MAVQNYTNMMNGRELVIQRVKKRFKAGMVLFWIMTALFLALGVIGFIVENYVLVVIGMIFILPVLIPAIIFLVKYTHPMNCKPIKKNPAILDQADYLFSHIAYQNDFIVACPGYFAPKSDVANIIAQQEVLLMFKRIITTNYATSYYLAVETVRGTTLIPYIKKMEPLVDETVNVIGPGCQYAKMGYNQDNMNYVEYMRTMWEEAQKQKNPAGR